MDGIVVGRRRGVARIQRMTKERREKKGRQKGRRKEGRKEGKKSGSEKGCKITWIIR